jgi:hypothetical protein
VSLRVPVTISGVEDCIDHVQKKKNQTSTEGIVVLPLSCITTQAEVKEEFVV